MKKAKACPTGKVRFKDHEQAVKALHRAANARHFAELDGSQTKREECRTYRCNACKGFHLTSQQSWGLAA